MDAALAMVPDGAVVGLGSGRAATRFIRALGARVAGGCESAACPTSQATADLATSLWIPLTTLVEIETIDIAIDGADEVDPQLNLIKGLGGALVREKIVAAAARQFVVLVGPEKIVSTLGERGVLPVEVVPFALAVAGGWKRSAVRRFPAATTVSHSRPTTATTSSIAGSARFADPAAVEQAIRSIPGIVGTGLFLGMADTVLIDRGGDAEIKHRRFN